MGKTEVKEYEDLIEALVGMAKITRPKIDTRDSPDVLRQKNIQHGICDIMEDAAVAIDDLMQKVKANEDRKCAEAA
jgi:hypothetical protein